MNEEEEDQLLRITQIISDLVKSDKVIPEMEDDAIMALESMSFFIANKDHGRAIIEGNNLINKLKNKNE